MTNLLEQALQLIPRQKFFWCKWLSRKQNSAGIWVNSYAEAVECSGSIQAIELSRYSQLGLDFEKHYLQLYTSAPIKYHGQAVSDMIIIDDVRYKIVGETPWHVYNGWVALTLIEDSENEQE